MGAFTHEIEVAGNLVTKRFLPGADDEANREWNALSALQRFTPGIAPQPLGRSYEQDGNRAETTMSLLPGVPVAAWDELSLNAVAVALNRLHASVPAPHLTSFPPRRWSARALYLEVCRRTQVIPAGGLESEWEEASQMASSWLRSPRAAALSDPPVEAVFGQGDGNTDNLLWDGTDIRFVDFEDSRVSDPAYEVADFIGRPRIRRDMSHGTLAGANHGVHTGTVTPEDVHAYCAAKWGAWEDQPWEGDVVFKVGPGGRGKIFVFVGDGETIGVKAATTRDEADEWLIRYPDDARVSAYIGRSGWNVLNTGGAIPDDELREAIDRSYELVVAGLPKKYRGPSAGTSVS